MALLCTQLLEDVIFVCKHGLSAIGMQACHDCACSLHVVLRNCRGLAWPRQSAKHRGIACIRGIHVLKIWQRCAAAAASAAAIVAVIAVAVARLNQFSLESTNIVILEYLKVI